LRLADGSISELGSGALPLGIRQEIELEKHEAIVDKGASLLLYTDGVVETLNGEGDSFGFERLQQEFAHGGGCQQIHDRVVRELDVFRGDESVFDDRSLVVISR
jgi:sigma-B regulation protein RsbU (phosphoserine phosphatase)